MKSGIEIRNLESQVIKSYSYFINNHRNINFDTLKSISLFTKTNMDKLIKSSEFKPYNVNSIQTAKDNFDVSLSYIDFVDVKRIY